MENYRRAVATLGALALFVAALVIVPARPAFALAATSAIGVGGDWSCVLESSGAAYCWGQNDHGKLGNGTSTTSLTPTPVAGGRTFTSLSVGPDHTCGIITNGDAYCWGRNSYGQLGDNTTTDSNTPALVSGGVNFASIASGDAFTCGISTGGTAYCWGSNFYGELGDSTNSDHHAPAAISGGGTYTAIAAGRGHVCAVATGGAAKCWGYNSNGQLGDNTKTDRNSPTTVLGGLTYSSISGGNNHTCAVRTNGAGYCWGFNGQGQLGLGNWNESLTPAAISGGLTLSSISAGLITSCGVTTTGLGYCWGNNTYGGLGDGTNTSQTIPVATAGGYRWTNIMTTNASPSICGTTDGGGVYCWGYNAGGTVGNNTTTDVNSPTAAWLFVGTGSVTITGIVDPSLTFTVAGRGTVCNGQSGTGFQTGSTSTSVSLGHLTSAAVAGAAQDLTLATNAANGFTVYIRTSGTTPNSFRTSGGATVADVSGTNASPGAAPVAGTAGFGYTSSDASTAFTSNTWAKLTNTDSAVLIGTAGTTSKSRCVGYGVAIAATSTAGSYSSSVVYTAVPSF